MSQLLGVGAAARADWTETTAAAMAMTEVMLVHGIIRLRFMSGSSGYPLVAFLLLVLPRVAHPEFAGGRPHACKADMAI